MSDATAPLSLPPDEADRLRAVRRYDILDTPPDGAFDRIALFAARFFDVPIATVTIVDADRIWFKAAHGIDVDEVGRDPGLCASAILQPNPYIVTDATADPACLHNPLVQGELGVRFYMGAPIRTPDGYRLGTVNVIDGRPRLVTDAEVEVLGHLADIVADELESRLVARRRAAAHDAQITALREDVHHLQGALDSRIIIEQAKGILAERHRESIDDAFRRLRLHARSTQQPLHRVAAAVTERTLRI